MSTEEAKRSINGALTVKPTTDERKSSPALTTESATSPAKKVIIKSADMKDDMQKEAVNIAISAFEKNNVEKDVAEHIKKEFDKRHGPTWHCIVGRNFAYRSQAQNFRFEEGEEGVRWDSWDGIGLYIPLNNPRPVNLHRFIRNS
ncbi:hypothetical protein CRYUN_Cryun40dG0014100 [Craigia yunnanensis]